MEKYCANCGQESLPVDAAHCVVDFCGRYKTDYPVQFWAFWHPFWNVVTFGGWWYTDQHIPVMYSETCPTEKKVHEWARHYGSPF